MDVRERPSVDQQLVFKVNVTQISVGQKGSGRKGSLWMRKGPERTGWELRQRDEDAADRVWGHRAHPLTPHLPTALSDQLPPSLS